MWAVRATGAITPGKRRTGRGKYGGDKQKWDMHREKKKCEKQCQILKKKKKRMFKSKSGKLFAHFFLRQVFL